MSLPAALAVHALILLALLTQPGRPPFGAVGAGLGTGMQVSLVSGFAGGGPRVGVLRADVLMATQVVPPSEPADGADGADPSDRNRTDPVPSKAATPQSPEEGVEKVGRGGNSGGDFEGAQGATSAAGGDPLATSDLLAQIARCLPPGFRPALPYGQIALTIGPDGHLSAAPQVISVSPYVSAEDRRVADRIVQAALLCGPYAHPDVVGRTISLAADFSRVGATAR